MFCPDEILAAMPHYDDSNIGTLVQPSHTENGLPQALPRRTIYGSTEAGAYGLVPMLDYPDMLPKQADWKEIIKDCHEKKIFPMYHRLASTVLPQKPNQNGLGHCWNYGMRAALEGNRSAEGQPEVVLAPNSLAWLVNWRNAGYYLDETIKAAKERGIAPASMCPEYVLNPSKFDPAWITEALKYRAIEWWDTNPGQGAVSMISQCLAALMTGRPGYIAYNWWGHALAMFGMDWDESQPNNILWLPFNSHSDGMISLGGSKGVPDEFYGQRASSVPGPTMAV